MFNISFFRKKTKSIQAINEVQNDKYSVCHAKRHPKHTFVCIGHSHLVSLQRASGVFFNDNENYDVQHIRLGEGDYSDYLINAESGLDFPNDLAFYLRSLNPETTTLVTCFGGNSHVVFGLVKHPVDYSITDDTTNITEAIDKFSFTRDLLIDSIAHQGGFPETVMCLKLARKYYKGKILQIESPPPICDESYLRKHAGVFNEQFTKFGITSPDKRLLMWKLHSNRIAEECAKFSISFINVPEEVKATNGYLAESCYSGDTNHANEIFGLSIWKWIVKGAADDKPV